MPNISKRLNKLRQAELKITHRLWSGLKEMPAKEMAAFILQNLGEGFGRGFASEIKKK